MLVADKFQSCAGCDSWTILFLRVEITRKKISFWPVAFLSHIFFLLAVICNAHGIIRELFILLTKRAQGESFTELTTIDWATSKNDKSPKKRGAALPYPARFQIVGPGRRCFRHFFRGIAGEPQPLRLLGSPIGHLGGTLRSVIDCRDSLRRGPSCLGGSA